MLDCSITFNYNRVRYLEAHVNNVRITSPFLLTKPFRPQSQRMQLVGFFRLAGRTREVAIVSAFAPILNYEKYIFILHQAEMYQQKYFYIA